MTTPVALTAAAPAQPSPSDIVTSPGGSQDHASIELYEAEPAPGGSKLGASKGSIKFQFNPKEITITKSAKWERKPVKGAKKAGPPEYSGSEPCKMTVEMFFDSTLKHDKTVVESVEALFGCCTPTDKACKSNKPMPHLVVFKWGGVTSFPAFITQVSAKYTRFASNGVPIRAVCQVSLEEMPSEAENQNPTSGALSADRVHTMIAGDTLALVAYREYGDSALWRPLAAYNGVDDPMGIPAGTSLMLPTDEALLTGVS